MVAWASDMAAAPTIVLPAPQGSTTTPVFPTPRPFDESTQVTYVGQEVVTVPAGTFVACRFDKVLMAASPQPTTSEWVVRGLVVKRWYSELNWGLDAKTAQLDGRAL